jgi:ketosteroid isomerase-like protein
VAPTISSRRPTPAQNDDVATVRRFFAAWTQGNSEAMVELVDPQVVVEPLLGVLYTRPIYQGRSGIAFAAREMALRWDRFEITVADALPACDQIIAHIDLVVEKHGMSCEGHVTVVCGLRNGLIVSLTGDDPL